MSVFAMHTRALFDEAPYQRTFTARVLAVSDQGVALDQTLFYPTGGGQPGDQGHFLLPDGSVVAVVGTQRDPLLRSMIWHQLEEGAGPVTAGVELQGCLDWERRYQHMKMHTCLHLLCSIIDAPVTGCSIAADKGRLDFDLPESTLDKERLTHALNELIEGALDVRTHMLPANEYNTVLEITRTQAVAPPVLQGMVRVVDIPGVDIQPCGGTHVRNTQEIGQVVCDKIEKKSRHNRRVTLRFA
ncbi:MULTISPECIES: alanyl-tRNA editing protein [unclassified Pseudomonas]|uniref:alanyl-tRNA editing protein n=1 Tax=unclassified Pseudomonas TaxID=196821 RepID=UPI001BCBB7C2|nr:alanyl-tRNA editing protein [Pseudomonas sp. Pc102]BBP84411.1 serine-tRNA(Ala) deacylase AlaX [Pseudomonas sp. Pc102]